MASTSYKNWQLLKESFGFPLGVKTPQSFLVGQQLEEGGKEKKMEDDEKGMCKCAKEMKDSEKHMKDMHKDGDAQTPADHSGKLWGGQPHKKAKPKKMKDGKKEMKDSKKKFSDKGMKIKGDMDVDDEEDMDMDDDLEGDDDMEDEEGDMEDEEGDMEDSDDVEDVSDEDDKEAKKYGFMKKKMKDTKKMKDQKKMKEEAFLQDLARYHVPKTRENTEEEFFASLHRQLGDPWQKHDSGLAEDMLLPLTNTEPAPETTNQPGPGEVGYAPQQRIGDNFSSTQESADDYKVLAKYFGKETADRLIRENNKK